MKQLIERRRRGLHHPIHRHNLGRDAFKGKEKMDGLRRKKAELEGKVSYRIHTWSSGASSVTKSVLFELESRTLILNDVMKAVEDEGAGVIGIYGIGGVGKSTLVKAIAQRAEESRRFLKVETLTVSRNPDAGKLRADVVNLVNEARVRAVEEMRKKKGERDKERMLIILDDFWERIDLTGCVENDDKLEVQLIFTSRQPKLLYSMNCHRNFKLDVLDPKEARQLLTKLVAENDVFKDAKLESLHDNQLEKTCAGLPLLIDALAQIIKRSNSPNPCEDALKQLPRNMDSVDTILDLSYNQLDAPVKTIFSLCALQGRQTLQIQTLLRYSVGLGLFDQNYTMEEARKKMKEWLMNLVGSSLVQNGDDSNHVKIHDVVRDFVVKYAFKRLPPPPRVQLDGKDESTEIEMLIFSPPGKTSNDDDNSGRHHYNVEINPGHQVLVRDFTVKHAVRSQYELDGKESLKIETFIAPAAETSCRESNDHIKIGVHDFVEKLAGIKGSRHVLVLEGGEPRIFISQAAELVGGEMC